jgi:hypothetical protein
LPERYSVTTSAIRRSVGELEAAGVIRFDATARLLYCPAGIEEDPPCTSQAVRAFASRLHDLPPSSLKTEIANAITRALAPATYPQLHQEWAQLLGARVANRSSAHSDADSAPESGADSGALLDPYVPPSAFREPEAVEPPAPPASRADFRATWLRSSIPPFAAAATTKQQRKHLRTKSSGHSSRRSGGRNG